MQLEQEQLDWLIKPTNEQIINLLPNGVVVIDGNGIVIRNNKAAIDLLGIDLMGRSWRDVIQKVFVPREDDGHEISLRDGRRVNIRICSLEMMPGELIVLTDLTTTRNYEYEKSRNQRLAEMGKMTAHLAHQIRTPLACAMIYTDHVATTLDLTQKQAHYIKKIKESHANIEQQISDLLLFAKGGTSLLVSQTSDDFLLMVKNACEAIKDNSCVKFNWDNQCPGLKFISHNESLVGALLNLINNSVQANASLITITIKKTGDLNIALSVQDDGDGISNEDIQKVSTPFFTKKSNGTGLGLAVVLAVANAHGGKLDIESQLGKGSYFTITIPWIYEN